jgi:hypothetical protein
MVDPFNSSSSPRNLKVTHNRYCSKYLDNVQPQLNCRIELKHIISAKNVVLQVQEGKTG